MSVTCKVSWTRSEIAGSKLSLHVFPSSLFPLFLPFTSPVLSLSLSLTCIYKTDTHIYTFTLPTCSLTFPLLSPIFHRLFRLIRHFHQPTFLFQFSLQLALNTRFLIDFSPSRWPARSPTPFSVSRQQRFNVVKRDDYYR